MNARRPRVDREALIAATMTMGFSEEVARAGIDAELDAWSELAIEATLAAELGPEPERARVPETVLVIAARTLPASTMRQVFAARVLGARVLVKAASGQEAVAEALARADAQVVATSFASSDTAALDQAIAQAQAVVVLGADATVEAVRERVPDDRMFFAHGHRASAGWVAADASDDDVRGLAEDVVAWDQAGCLAPQMIWVTGDVGALGVRLADALIAVERDLPMALDAAARHAHNAAKTHAIMVGGRTWCSESAVVASHPGSAFRASPGHRFVWLVPADVDALRAFMPQLSTLAVDRSSRTPLGLGPHVRVCAPGQMQRPPLAWRQDGLPLFPLARGDRRELSTAPAIE